MGLLAIILIHGFNGARIVLFDLGYGVKKQKQIFVTLMVLASIPLALAFAVALPHIFV